MHQHSISWLSRIYTLLNESCPILLKQLDYDFPAQAIVAANLLISTENEKYVGIITSESKTQFHCTLDLGSTSYQSKGDWIWVTQVEINAGKQFLLSITMNKRVVDIPYCGKTVSAFCLFKNFYPELLTTLKKELVI